MLSRRNFLGLTGRLGLATATMPLWTSAISRHAFAQSSLSSYKAVVVITLVGGNDGNNMLVPLDGERYSQYARSRPSLALPQGSLLPLSFGSAGANYGLHPSMPNLAKYFNAKEASIVANVGPLSAPATKANLLANPNLMPAALLNHAAGIAQWESASTGLLPSTGWGGRVGDVLAPQSGSLPPVLDAGSASIFTVGNSVQAIAVQADSGPALAVSASLNSAILDIANDDANSPNQIVAQAAKLRSRASKEQALLTQAQATGGAFKTIFPAQGFGLVMSTIANVIKGRAVIGASRQIFYCNQGDYDTHVGQLSAQASNLSELDTALGAFMSAMDELGLRDQVLVCTHSDFNRTMQANTSLGTDHAWGSHQLVLGGLSNGGQVAGTMPDLELGGAHDIASSGQGIWIPTTSVTQMTGGIGSWMGLTATQLASVFPDLINFGNQVVSLS